MEEKEIYEKAVKHWGYALQVNQSIQEMSELIKELTKIFQGKTNPEAIVEEMIDVQIMLNQMEYIMKEKMGLAYHSTYESYFDKKLKRIEELLTASNNDFKAHKSLPKFCPRCNLELLWLSDRNGIVRYWCDTCQIFHEDKSS